jgi:hypothetical protein
METGATVAQRESGYERKERDAYMTPRWVTQVLVDDLEREGFLPLHGHDNAGKLKPLAIWEPAAGTGQMADALAGRGYEVFCTDILPEPGVGFRHDFTDPTLPVLFPAQIGGVITNPPYDQADEFVAIALRMMEARGGLVAMLLKVDWDSGKTRRRFFADCAGWARKLVLLDRIYWFDPSPGGATPSENHAWFVWSFARRHVGRGASIGYVETPAAERDRLRACRKGKVAA